MDKEKLIDVLTAIKRELVDVLVGTDAERHKAFGYCMAGLEEALEILEGGEDHES